MSKQWEIERLQAENKLLLAGMERLEKDAERYRWLRGEHGISCPMAAVVWWKYKMDRESSNWVNTTSPESLDANIDAAMFASGTAQAQHEEQVSLRLAAELAAAIDNDTIAAVAGHHLRRGDYVLASKYNDGDPQDQWFVGFYRGICGSYDPPRYDVEDGNGVQQRGNGFRRVERISPDCGAWLVQNAKEIAASGRSVWEWVEIAGCTPDPDGPCQKCGKWALDTGWECGECGFDNMWFFYPQGAKTLQEDNNMSEQYELSNKPSSIPDLPGDSVMSEAIQQLKRHYNSETLDTAIRHVSVKDARLAVAEIERLTADLAEAREIIRLTRTDDVMAGRECSFHREIDAFLYRTEGM